MQIYGKHFHNAKDQKEKSSQYVYSTLLTNLASKEMHDLGVSYPVSNACSKSEMRRLLSRERNEAITRRCNGLWFDNVGSGHGPFGPGPIMPGGLAVNAADDENSVNVRPVHVPRAICLAGAEIGVGIKGAGATGTAAQFRQRLSRRRLQPCRVAEQSRRQRKTLSERQNNQLTCEGVDRSWKKYA